MLAIWGRECSFPDLHQQINELIGKNNKQQIHLTEQSQNFLICKT